MQKDSEPITVEHTFNAAAESVWKAITDLDLMRQWYFEEIPSFRPEVGFETRFKVSSADRDFLHVWRVTEVVPLRKIAYRWKYDGYPGDSYVVFELAEEGGLTRLTVTHRVLESFPDDIPEFRRESGMAGWEFFIQKRLPEFLQEND